MTTARTAELRKLRATRSTWSATAATLALTAAVAAANVLLAGEQDNPPLDGDTFQHVLRAPAPLIGFTMLLVGVLVAAGEYRHRTIVTTLVTTPRRNEVLLAKAAAVVALGLTLAAAAAVVSTAVGQSLLAGADAPAQRLAPVPAALLVLALAAVLHGLLGLGLGLLLRNQAAALTVALLWWFAAEQVVTTVVGEAGTQRWLPGGAARAALALGDSRPAGLLTPPQGAALLTAYVLVLLGLAAWSFARRDQP